VAYRPGVSEVGGQPVLTGAVALVGREGGGLEEVGGAGFSCPRDRAALRRVLEAIWCLFIDRGSVRLAVVELLFKGGACRRFILCRKKAHGGPIAPHPAVEGFAFVPPDLIRKGENLHHPAVVRRVEERLRRQEVVVIDDLEQLAKYPGRMK
jgi:hypothetical protein